MNSFRVNYPGGGRQHIKKPEIDGLLLARLIELREGTKNQYDWIGPMQSLSALSELGKLSIGNDVCALRRFLSGQFIIEFKDKRRRELLETAEECAIQLPKRIRQLEQAEAQKRSRETPESIGMRVTQATA